MMDEEVVSKNGSATFTDQRFYCRDCSTNFSSHRALKEHLDSSYRTSDRSRLFQSNFNSACEHVQDFPNW